MVHFTDWENVLNILPSHRRAQELLCPAGFSQKSPSPGGVRAGRLNPQENPGARSFDPSSPIPTPNMFNPVPVPTNRSFSASFRDTEQFITLKVHLRMSASRWYDLEISNRASIQDLINKVDSIVRLSPPFSKRYRKISSHAFKGYLDTESAITNIIYSGGAIIFGADETARRQTVSDMGFQDDDRVVVEGYTGGSR